MEEEMIKKTIAGLEDAMRIISQYGPPSADSQVADEACWDALQFLKKALVDSKGYQW